MLHDVARDNGAHGVEVIQSNIVITDLMAHGNGRVGLIVNRHSELRLVDAVLEDNAACDVACPTAP